MLSLGANASGQPATVAADWVLLHGRVYTEDPERRVVQAVAWRANTLIFVGSDIEARAWIGPLSHVVDLHGRTVMPGIIDAHTHPAMSAQDTDKCSLSDKKITPSQVKRRVARCLQSHPDDGTGWREVVMVNPSGLTLSRSDLDSMSATVPLLLSASDGHTLWANSPALAAARIDASTPNPAGGEIQHDAAGMPTGTLRDDATLIETAARPAPSLEYQSGLLAKVLAAMRATGITSVQDASVDAHWMSLYKRLYDQHRLDMRVRGSFHLQDLHRPTVVVEQARAFRDTWAIDPDFLRADAVKIFADGVVEYPSQTAALLSPYLDADGRPTSNIGPSYFTQAELDEVVSGANAAALTVHVHAIGDRAVRMTLNAFEESRRRNGALDSRNQIAHLELVDPADFPRFKALGVIANFQLQWAERDDYTESATIRYLGPVRARYLYPARSLRDAGAHIVGGSDWGVSTFNAFEAMEHAITRSAHPGAPPLLPEQGLTLQDMVDAYTVNAAFALRQEKTTGSLEVGKRADLIVLDRDIFAVKAGTLRSTRVLSTVLDGREVYSASHPPGAKSSHSGP